MVVRVRDGAWIPDTLYFDAFRQCGGRWSTVNEVLTIIALCIATLIVLGGITWKVAILWFNVQLKKRLPKPAEVRQSLETGPQYEMISHLPAFLSLGTPERVIGNEEVTVAYWRWTTERESIVVERILLLQRGMTGHIRVTFADGVMRGYRTQSEVRGGQDRSDPPLTERHMSFEIGATEDRRVMTKTNLDHVTTILNRVRPPAS